MPPLKRARAKEEGWLADPLKVASAMAKKKSFGLSEAKVASPVRLFTPRRAMASRLTGNRFSTFLTSHPKLPAVVVEPYRDGTFGTKSLSALIASLSKNPTRW